MAQFPASGDACGQQSDRSLPKSLKSVSVADLMYGPFSCDTEIWHNLKYAISLSSGFQRWQLECNSQLQGLRLEQQVQRYLRETLETLAY